MTALRAFLEAIAAAIALAVIAVLIFGAMAGIIVWGNWLGYTAYTTLRGLGMPWVLCAIGAIAAPIAGVFGPFHAYSVWSRKRPAPKPSILA